MEEEEFFEENSQPEEMPEWAKIIWREKCPQPGETPPTLEELAWAYGELHKRVDRWTVPEGSAAQRAWLIELKERYEQVKHVCRNKDVLQFYVDGIEKMQAIVDRLDAEE